MSLGITFMETRKYVHRCRPFEKDVSYVNLYHQGIPQPHTSGYWQHGFEFNNDYFLLLAVL